MLQVNYIRENKALVLERLAVKNFNAPTVVNELLNLDDERHELQFVLETLSAEANAANKQVGDLMRKGNTAEAEEIKANVAGHKQQIKELNEQVTALDEKITQILYTIPNLPYKQVPAGKTAEDNEVVLQWQPQHSPAANGIPHWELAKKYNLIDFELGNKITGAGFPVYINKGARLQRGLINFFLDNAVAAGYIEVQVPHVVNEASGYATGQLPDKEGQMYHIQADDLYLIPTAEVPVTNIYRDVVLTEQELPVKHTAYTPCFRREAGSYGAHVRGLNRLHQFDKVELVQVVKPADSYSTLEDMSTYVQGLLQKLGLQYRVLRLCGGDMSFASAMTYDMEVYSSAQQRWLEVSSVSNFEAFQANRLKLRYKGTAKGSKTTLCHTLNGSALALPRIVAALLENYQSPEGIVIPEALVPYVGFSIIN